MALKWILNKNLGYDAFDEEGHLVGMIEHLSDNSWGASVVSLPDGWISNFDKLYTRGYLADEAKSVVEDEWEKRKVNPMYKDIFRNTHLI